MTRIKCLPSAGSVTVTRLSALPPLSSLPWMFLPSGPYTLSTLSSGERIERACTRTLMRCPFFPLNTNQSTSPSLSMMPLNASGNDGPGTGTLFRFSFGSVSRTFGKPETRKGFGDVAEKPPAMAKTPKFASGLAGGVTVWPGSSPFAPMK